ncbi:glycoside hydrolase domain-containing protein [Microbacterium mangrovi]|uniref:glycoside hydrolase domain-containing protein n=1 Tax=Microbacterium mangrovi TaxID=1348253 RepID=UPI00068A34C3|nr:glycoside hydrolase domain-containing protein [Microbacterium mangrovi]
MTDPMVLQTQMWLNQTYQANPQWRAVTEDGYTGWGTIFGLIRGLQIELGIQTLADNFGAGTLAAFASKYGSISEATTTKNVIHLAQGALWCKGYAGGYQGGVFDGTMKQAVLNVTADMGIGASSSIDGKVLKSLMSMDAYTPIAGGTASRREVQQWLNGRYGGRRDFSLLPCDGIFSRNTQQGMMFAIQYELGMADGVANGNFGPGTKAGLKAQAGVSVGSSDGSKNWVRLYQGALRFNGYDSAFDGAFRSGTRDATLAFQSFAALTASGAGDYRTWASLLISTGDETRPGIASDMATQLSTDQCALLYANGYRTVGRYLTVASKRYLPGELERIFAAGLATFPIMQEANTSTADFNYEKGRDHGLQALVRLRQLGFKDGTTVFFAVDFDALDDQITMYVIPYFQGVRDVLNSTRVTYKTGVYGTRNVCTTIINAGLASEAFVSDMSWGYSGNLGFALPPSWSYDQISGQALGALTGPNVAIDKDVQSARANPARRADVLPTPLVVKPPSSTFTDFDEDYFWYLTRMTVAAEAVESEVTGRIAADLVLHYLQRPKYWHGGGGELAEIWPVYAPLPEHQAGIAADLANEISRARGAFEKDAERPVGALEDRIQHWAASSRGYMTYSRVAAPVGSTTTTGDLGAWALDLAQAWKAFCGKASPSPASLREWMATYIGHKTVDIGFGWIDLIGDIDAFLVDDMLRTDPFRPLSDCIREIEVGCERDEAWRFRQFISRRFNGSVSMMAAAGKDALAGEALWTAFPRQAVLWDAPTPTSVQAKDVGDGFADAIARFAGL